METDVIYLGDCRDILPRIPAESVDCVVTDVAYRVNCAGRGTMSGAFVESARRGAVFSENDVAIEDYIGELYRILKPETHCYIFCNNLNLPHFLDAITRRSGFRFIKSLIWDKCRKISGRYYMGCFEYILFLRKGGDRQINDCSTPDILRYPTPRKLEYSGGGIVNTTQKPVGLIEELVRNSTNAGEIVLDAFMGSGTTAVACARIGRHFIGCEIDARQVEFARKRVEAEASQGKLF